MNELFETRNTQGVTNFVYPSKKFANTEPNRISTSLAVAKCGEASEGPERDGHKPLMRNRGIDITAVSPTGSTASDTFPNAPGFKREGTSELAATSMRSRSNNLQEAVLNVLKRHSATPDEVAMELAGSILAIRPRFSELVALGKIRETGARRVNQSGKLANVYELIP